MNKSLPTLTFSELQLASCQEITYDRFGYPFKMSNVHTLGTLQLFVLVTGKHRRPRNSTEYVSRDAVFLNDPLSLETISFHFRKPDAPYIPICDADQ